MIQPEELEYPTVFTERTLRIPGHVVIDVLLEHGYDLPEGSFMDDAVVQFPVERRKY